MQPAERRAVTVTTTYLELPSRAAFRPAFIDAPEAQIMQTRVPLVAYARFLYDAVGRDYHWSGRRAWSDERWQAHLARPTTTLLVLYWSGAPAGYIELDAAGEEPGTEIAYFGLIPVFHGRGLGKHLLSVGVARAFDDGAARVWVHTCSLDGPYALPNYQARGFRPYRVEQEETTIEERETET
jgi:ribosomal protein S18 acetylase RimI-like enzyme